VAAEPTAPRVLVVDDDEGLLVLMAEALRAEQFEVTTAPSARAARAALDRRPPDLLVLDLKLRDGSGPALVADLQRDRPPVPFMVVTGQGDEKVAVEVMKQGALDYVMKDSALVELLPTIVRRALTTVAQGQALAAAQAERRRLEREILEVGERERHSIGADLHDGLGQQLTALEFLCTSLKADAAGHPRLREQLELMGRMLREAVAQTRFLARGLVPVGSGPDALQNGLTELADRVNSLGGVRCELACPRPVAVRDPFVAGHLYRIAQEAVNNAVKHARAGTVTVRLSAEAGTLRLEVDDDGRGLPQTAAPHGGLGLGVMRHRANVIGATLTVSSRRPGGVAVSCLLPLAP
jgi:signal transduction histidine kinase